MTKSGEIILITSVVYLVSLFGVIQAVAEAPTQTQTQFHVEGKVYCDVCRALFENRLSKPMSGILRQNNKFLYFLNKILKNIFFSQVLKR